VPQLLHDADQSFLEMNTEQRNVFSRIVDSVHTYARERSSNFPPFFLEGKPGRGKTFVVNAICNRLRGENHIVLIVGSSALAATLYDGGQTAHNLFQIPVTEVRFMKL
jgi:chromosomal replication initiation ATPase DnaA